MEDTSKEEKAIELLAKLRMVIDTIGGTVEADRLRHDLEERVNQCYALLRERIN